MGAVYLASDPRTGRPLAIKTLALGREFHGPELAEARLRFTREAEAAGRLMHPGIVAILDCGEEQGLAWIAMEHLPGHDLTRHVTPANLLPVTEVLGLVRQVAEALAYAHAQGVMHRDVKPANVLLDPGTGVVKLTDFGIARIADSIRTRTGMVLGTPSYMSPEQIAGQQADGRSDLYALGVMLFQLLCARLPHEAHSLGALLNQIANQRAPDVRELRPDLPEALANLVARALEKQPALRPADGRQFALELRTVTSDVKFSRTDPRHNPDD